MQNKMNRFIFYGKVQLISTNGQREGKKRLSFQSARGLLSGTGKHIVRHRGRPCFPVPDELHPIRQRFQKLSFIPAKYDRGAPGP